MYLNYAHHLMFVIKITVKRDGQANGLSDLCVLIHYQVPIVANFNLLMNFSGTFLSNVLTWLKVIQIEVQSKWLMKAQHKLGKET